MAKAIETRRKEPRTATAHHRRLAAAALAAAVFRAVLPAGAAGQGSASTDRAALEALHAAAGGANWADSTNWLTDAPLDEWHGVTTGGAGRVTRLSLVGNGLTGPIPDALGDLTSLEELDFGVNGLTGPIPDALGGLTNLRGLSLQVNGLTGPIPDALGNLTNLEKLDFGFNGLTGPIPDALGDLTNLHELSLQSNGLTGPIPDALGNLTNLGWLSLSGNALTGPIPDALGNLTILLDLHLGGNGLTGPVPDFLGRLPNLRGLDLRWNDLTGPVPDFLGRLPDLDRLYLNGNWGLSGPLPPGLRSAGSLETLDVAVTRACAPAAWRSWLATIEFTGRLCGDETVTIDVAVVYTPAARAAAGGTAAIEAVIDLMVAETNLAYAASGVRHRMALAGRAEVQYTEVGNSVVDLDVLADPSDGLLDEAHTLRDEVGADLVHLIVDADRANVGGIAYLVGAFGLTIHSGGGLVFAHELGHNLGLRHDRYQAHHLEGGAGPHPAHGYVNQRAFAEGAPASSRWLTIMSYPTQCEADEVPCSQLPRFSNPRQRHEGDPLGVPYVAGVGATGVAGPADAAAVLDATAPVIALWRDRVARPNRAPAAVGALREVRLFAPGGSTDVDVSRAFVDHDGDRLTWAVSSSAPAVAAVAVSGARLTLTAAGAGAATVTVTAADPGGLRAAQSFAVRVYDRPASPDAAALEAIYAATGGADWADRTNWLTDAPLGEWYGVRTDGAGRVTGLHLRGNGLSGAIPDAFGDLANLETLRLGGDGLSGAIPDALGNLTNLKHLSFFHSGLTGPIPAALGRLTNLEELDLRGNRLTGPIPAAFGRLTNLEGLDLAQNRLTGPIPAALGNLTNLERLFLGGNGLTGPIPAAFGRLTNLEELGLWGNGLTGAVPAALGNLTNLESLFLNGNDLTGPVSSWLGNPTRLRDLNLSRLWGVSGPLPPGLRSAESLQYLNLAVTQACAPAAWRDWLKTIEFTGRLCRDEAVTVDVAVVYTPAAREAAGGAAAIEAVIDLMVAETNQAYAASGVRHRVALAGRTEVQYAEDGFSAFDLDRLVDPSDGHLDEAHTLRDQVGADLVHLIVDADRADVGGIATLLDAFGLTIHSGGGLVFAHELGHNLGLEHDRYQAHRYEGGAGSYPAYGYVNQRGLADGAPPSSGWVTVMAYYTQCYEADVSCSWLPRFSNPRRRHGGDPLGVPYVAGAGASGVAGPADAAAVLDATAPAIALWRDRVARPNRPPAAAGALPDVTLTPGGRSHVDVSRAFADPDGDALAYAVSSSAPTVVTVSAAGARVTLTAAGAGRSTVTVTATDPGGLSAAQSFTATVSDRPPATFTDHPIRPGVTPVRAVHFTELRARIDGLRAAAGLGRFPWTDPVLAAGVTRVRLVHLVELRTALAAAYAAAGRPPPVWTDAPPAAGSTPVRAAHLMELRAAVTALE